MVDKSVEILLDKYDDICDLSNRITFISAYFLGCPYEDTPLVGSAYKPEKFVTNLKTFDCVTFCETVLALALSPVYVTFRETLQKIRYKDGKISWFNRNHYMSNWLSENKKQGIFENITATGLSYKKVKKSSTLLKELGTQVLEFETLSQKNFLANQPLFKSGDFVAFASTKKNLDAFHCGFLIWEKEVLLLRHAAKSKKFVVNEPLQDFLDRNEIAGILLARPIFST